LAQPSTSCTWKPERCAIPIAIRSAPIAVFQRLSRSADRITLL